jgi:hypothetical protein
MHPHPSMNSGQALNPLPSRERKSSKVISEEKLRERVVGGGITLILR